MMFGVKGKSSLNLWGSGFMKKMKLMLLVFLSMSFFIFLISCAYSQYYPNISGQWALYIYGQLDDGSAERIAVIPDATLLLSREPLGRITGSISGSFLGPVAGTITSGGVISLTATRTTADSQRTPAVLLQFSGGIYPSDSSKILGTVTVRYESGNDENFSWQAVKVE